MNKKQRNPSAILISNGGVPLRNTSARKSPVLGTRKRMVVKYGAINIKKNVLQRQSSERSSFNKSQKEIEICEI